MPSFPRELLLPSQEAESPCDLTSSLTPSAGGLASLGGDITSLAGGLTDSESAGALLALSEHATVLRLIWEAHARGAIALPPTLARRVVQARRSIPKYLSVSSAGAFAQVAHTPAAQRDAV
ncbi:MAG TPA: hypothetical protein VFA43_00995 [Gemmatimonadaceae bacterium]|nr:hypothetical protein [Gemmatimonadaceae bacterium]